MSAADLFDWNAWPLVPAVVQDPDTLQVLMVGFMNREALETTVERGLVTFYSRSRETLWTKGETSGNVLNVVELRINCEENSILVAATPVGPTCHTGHQSCYFRRIEPDGSLTVVMERVDQSASMQDASGSNANLTRRWYGAYEYLRDNDLSAVSGTSKRLRDPSFRFEARIADELLELAGVLDGTHTHHGLIGDVMLEGSQIAYWTASLAVRSGVTWDNLRPDASLANGKANASNAEGSQQLREAADAWRARNADGENLTIACQELLELVATACLTAGVDPFALIRRDLDEQQERDYLAPYFSH